ncbi:hypothetical protein XENOCAPTIV_014190 [Xenoophorus captivus]|uniref:Uncharacterized protein n=1 Tax=Xenoophorus captivus TaxID=1517983 RepID=A0ABV0QI79_9TELE
MIKGVLLSEVSGSFLCGPEHAQNNMGNVMSVDRQTSLSSYLLCHINSHLKPFNLSGYLCQSVFSLRLFLNPFRLCCVILGQWERRWACSRRKTTNPKRQHSTAAE